MTKKVPPLDPSRLHRAGEEPELPRRTTYEEIPAALRPVSDAVDSYRRAVEAKDDGSAVLALLFATTRLEQGWLALQSGEHADVLPITVKAIEDAIASLTLKGGQYADALGEVRERALRLRLACWWWEGHC